MRNKWWFYLAWFLAAAVSIISSFVVIIYGITFSNTKAETWIAGFLIATLQKIILFDPIRVSVIAFWRVYRTRKPPADYSFDEELKPLKEKELHRIKRRLDYLMDLFRQRKWKKLSSSEQEQTKEMEENLVRYNMIFSDLLMLIFYMLALHLIVMGSKEELSYYSTRYVRDFFTSGKNNRPPTEHIITRRHLVDYLNQTILEKLHRTRFYGNHGYLDGRSIKLLGVARLRQHRIRRADRPFQHKLNVPECNGYFSYTNFDTGSYSANWKPWINFRYNNTYWRLFQPWKYMTAWQSETLPIYGEHHLYPGGGYTANLGRNYENSKHILQYLFKSEWIDHRTAVVFLELTLYCVNANLFNIVTVIIERTPFGSFSSRISIKTSKLLFILSNMHWTMWIALILYFILIGLFSYRLLMQAIHEEERITRDAWDYVDVVIIIFSLITGILFLLRNFYVVSLLESVEDSRKNTFRSFFFAAIFDDFFSWMSATLVTISTIRLWKVLHFALVFRVLSGSLYRSAKSLVVSIFLLSIFLIAISNALHVINGNNATRFSTFTKSFTTMMAFTASLTTEINPSDLQHGGQLLGIMFYGIQQVVINIFILNMIITVACFYFDETKAQMSNIEKTQYTFWDFLKDEYEQLSAKVFNQDSNQYTRQSLRLRGGGGILSRIFSKSKRPIHTLDEPKQKVEYTDEKAGLVNEIINTQMDYLEKYMSLRLQKVKTKKQVNINETSNTLENDEEKNSELTTKLTFEFEGQSEDEIEDDNHTTENHDKNEHCVNFEKSQRRNIGVSKYFRIEFKNNANTFTIRSV